MQTPQSTSQSTTTGGGGDPVTPSAATSVETPVVPSGVLGRFPTNGAEGPNHLTRNPSIAMVMVNSRQTFGSSFPASFTAAVEFPVSAGEGHVGRAADVGGHDQCRQLTGGDMD
eukprot:5765545-Pyramimonas_sp.AAC.1